MSRETIICPVRTNAEQIPEIPALITHERTWNWAELDALLSGTADKLYEIAQAGSRVAVQLPNSPELVVLVLAALRTGHVLAPISIRLPERAACERTRAIAAKQVILSGLSIETGDQGVEVPPIPLSRPASIIHTSGSLGEPKAALHTVGNHVWSARGLNKVISLDAQDRWLLALPLHHVGGLAIIYRCALAGAAVVLPDPDEKLEQSIAANRITHASFVGTQLYRLLRIDANLNSLNAVLTGGSSISSELIVAARNRSLPVFTSYGLTEMASTVTASLGENASGHVNSSGQLLPHRELAIQEGEIRVRGKTQFAGYVEGERLIQPFDDEGWFATGDLGYMDEDGHLYVTGRKDNQFVSGGENIQPEEIERVLEAIPQVIQAIVVPLADEEFGHRPVAFVNTLNKLEPKMLSGSLADQLPRFKLPVAIHPWPLSKGFKLNRATFRDEAERLRS